MKEKNTYWIIAVSCFFSSIAAFSLYLQKYMNSKIEVRNQIESMLQEIGVIEENYAVAMGVVLVVGTLLFLCLEFVTYKIMFQCTKVHTEDLRLLSAIGCGLTLAFLAAYILTGRVSDILVTFLSNMIEIVVIFGCLYGQMKRKIFLCMGIRGVLLLVNMAAVII